ncbi:MAG: iron-sulfur cluster assembly accessory protein [Anaerolineae bacterium]|nr:iron-sulfur cluster assembly accessory protein [Anaerolineae bacterium]
MSYVNEEMDVVVITALAAEKVRDMMTERGLTDHALRIFVAGASCSGVQYGLAFEKTPQENDTVVDVESLKIVVDPQSLPFVRGASIDFVQTPRGAGFRVENPHVNIGAACGGGCCG